MTRQIVSVGGVRIGDGFVFIAGPCAVESEELTLEIAREVRAAGAHILRGGAFKPRTSPYSFQGLAEEGLRILQKAGRAELVAPMNLGAAAAGIDGLLIEVHPHPDQALSDKEQQITPRVFARISAGVQALLGGMAADPVLARS
jgi:3-deoxy-D-arabino-heptulosonate 7-phosphate (DAHP) synthase